MNQYVQLWTAKIPWVGWIAVHYWYVVLEAGNDRGERWEVWQRRELVKTSWGHLHKNLLPPDSGVGNGPGWLVQQWSGSDACRLTTVINASPDRYPHTHIYRYWPGPNSNTYVQWILDQAAIDYSLNWRGLGKGYA